VFAQEEVASFGRISAYVSMTTQSVSHRGIRLGSFEKVECLGSRADAKAAAGVPDVCPDCVRGENE
jgi:hypothetical protein